MTVHERTKPPFVSLNIIRSAASLEEAQKVASGAGWKWAGLIEFLAPVSDLGYPSAFTTTQHCRRPCNKQLITNKVMVGK